MQVMTEIGVKPLQNPDRPCIVTCALSGVVANRDQCPAIPYTPEEYAREAKSAYDAGAAVVHIHARTPDGFPSYEVEDYQKIVGAIRDACPIATNFSTGAIGIPTEKKIAPILECKPALGALNMGSMNYAKYHPKRKDFVFEFVFENPFSEIRELLEAMNSVSTRPEMECFDAGHVANSYPLIHMGVLEPPFQYSLILGVNGGIAATVDSLVHQVNSLPPQSEWEIIGISLRQWRLVGAAIALGGNVRVGLEDNFYLAKGEMAASNGDLVAKAVRMIRDQGREPATVDQARERLGLKNQ